MPISNKNAYHAVFWNRRREWAEYPDWPYRYDCVTKPGPAFDPETAIPHDYRATYSSSRLILYYENVPFRSIRQKLRGLVKHRQYDLYLTAFVYDDAELGGCTVTCEALCAVFRTLVNN